MLIRFHGPTDFLEVEGKTIPRGGQEDVSEEAATFLLGWEDVDVSTVSEEKPEAAGRRAGRNDKEGE